MIEAIGIDIVETERMRKSMARFGNRFIDRILGPLERPVFDARVDKATFLAGRFACKEATVKALGRYLTDRPSLSSIQIVNDSTGRPAVVFSEEVATALNGISCLVSLSHERNYAVGMAVCAAQK
ncbi:MAG: holo-ACP synthase [candidate division Zixibacteria bacterium]|nr:holo-ACP synthase [candidate division Zixibacteria bacterium]